MPWAPPTTVLVINPFGAADVSPELISSANNSNFHLSIPPPVFPSPTSDPIPLPSPPRARQTASLQCGPASEQPTASVGKTTRGGLQAGATLDARTQAAPGRAAYAFSQAQVTAR